MDAVFWLQAAGYAIQYGPLLKDAIDEAASNDDLVTKARKIAGPFFPILEQIGGLWFPQAKPALRAAAAIMTSFDPNVTKWLQTSLNTLVVPSPNLTVDGLNGPKTQAAVKAFQTQAGMADVDGWAGTLTRMAIDGALAALQQKSTP